MNHENVSLPSTNASNVRHMILDSSHKRGSVPTTQFVIQSVVVATALFSFWYRQIVLAIFFVYLLRSHEKTLRICSDRIGTMPNRSVLLFLVPALLSVLNTSSLASTSAQYSFSPSLFLCGLQIVLFNIQKKPGSITHTLILRALYGVCGLLMVTLCCLIMWIPQDHENHPIWIASIVVCTHLSVGFSLLILQRTVLSYVAIQYKSSINPLNASQTLMATNNTLRNLNFITCVTAGEELNNELSVLLGLIPSITCTAYVHAQSQMECVTVLFLMTCVWCSIFTAFICLNLVPHTKRGTRISERAILLLLSICFLLFTTHYALAHQRTGADPLQQVVRFGLQTNPRCLFLALGCVLGSLVPFLYVVFAKKFMIRREVFPKSVLRKWFHVVATVAYTPFIVFAFGMEGYVEIVCAFRIALGMFILIECARNILVLYLPSGILKTGQHSRFSSAKPSTVQRAIHTLISWSKLWSTAFLDERDFAVLRSHIYLLLGMYVPVTLIRINMISATETVPFPLLLTGVAALGVYDSTAACVGSAVGNCQFQKIYDYLQRHLHGTRHLPTAVGKRTLEGTFAGIFVTTLFLHHFEDPSSPWSPGYIFGSVTLGALSEALLEDIDNLLLPLIWMTWMLIVRYT